MRALTLHAPYDLRYESVADPTLEEPADVIVRVEIAGLCGSDLHPYRGNEMGWDAGTVMGHELVGEVVETGSGVGRFAVGDRVVAPFSTCCGACFYCVRGLSARCEHGQLFGWVEEGLGLHGAQAEIVRVPLADSTLVAVPPDADAESVLFAGDILSTGLFAAEMGDVGADDVVAVLGCGPVGLMAVAACRELGAERIYAVDRVPERLALAERLGGQPVDFSNQDPAALLADATDGRGADVALEMVGTPQATRLAMNLLRPGGTLVAVGVHTEEHFAFAPGEAYDKNLTYRAGRCSARHYMDRAVPIAASGRHDLASIITHRLPLADGVEAYEMFEERRDGCVKVLLRP